MYIVLTFQTPWKLRKLTGSEKRSNFNERLRKRLSARDPAVILNEMMIRVQQDLLRFVYELANMQWLAVAEFDGQSFNGTGRNKHDARQMAAMSIFKYLKENPHVQPQMDMCDKTCLGLHFLQQAFSGKDFDEEEDADGE